METVVRSTNASESPLRELGCRFTEVLKTGDLTEVERICAKVGQAATSGMLARNATLLGILVSSVDHLERQERGKETMRHRQTTDTEADLIRDAASLLVANGCAPSLLKEFGLCPGAQEGTCNFLDTLLSEGDGHAV